MMNKRGWIKIVEAFIAIMLLAGIVLLAVNQGQNREEQISLRIQNSERSIVRDIQLDNAIRNEITNVSAINLPLEWGDFDTQAPLTKARIIEKTPSYIECSAKICNTNSSCLLSGNNETTVYAESVIITSTIQTYNPRLLQLFCWEKTS